jgi:hypothetical protein
VGKLDSLGVADRVVAGAVEGLVDALADADPDVLGPVGPFSSTQAVAPSTTDAASRPVRIRRGRAAAMGELLVKWVPGA